MNFYHPIIVHVIEMERIELSSEDFCIKDMLSPDISEPDRLRAVLNFVLKNKRCLARMLGKIILANEKSSLPLLEDNDIHQFREILVVANEKFDGICSQLMGAQLELEECTESSRSAENFEIVSKHFQNTNVMNVVRDFVFGDSTDFTQTISRSRSQDVDVSFQSGTNDSDLSNVQSFTFRQRVSMMFHLVKSFLDDLDRFRVLDIARLIIAMMVALKWFDDDSIDSSVI